MLTNIARRSLNLAMRLAAALVAAVAAAASAAAAPLAAASSTPRRSRLLVVYVAGRDPVSQSRVPIVKHAWAGMQTEMVRWSLRCLFVFGGHHDSLLRDLRL